MIFENKYKKIEKVGQGSYGTVYKALNIKNKKLVAIKIITIEENEDGIPSTTLREIAHLRQLDHPNIIKLLDLYFEKNKIYLVFEYIKNDLRNYLLKNKNLSDKIVLKILYQISEAINYLHYNQISHRDLKPDNILIDKNNNIKIIDFGLSKFSTEFNQNRSYSEEVSTIWYKAPEILLGNYQYDCSIDIFSIGWIISEILIGKPWFNGKTEIEQLFQIFKLFGTPNFNDWPELDKYPYFNKNYPSWRSNNFSKLLKEHTQNFELINLLSKMLILNPKTRIISDEIVENDIFLDYQNN